MLSFWFFFFQAEDGIRDLTVTGVQTCALPIMKSHINGGATWLAGPASATSGLMKPSPIISHFFSPTLGEILNIRFASGFRATAISLQKNRRIPTNPPATSDR